MKTKNKIVILTAVMLIIGTLLSNVAFAATMTKEALEKNIKAYSDGTKTATATVGGDTITVGKSTGNVTVDDSTIKIEAEGTTFVVNYTLSDAEATFSMVQNYKSDMTDTDYLVESLKTTGMLPICFLAVTDAQEVDSNKALTYYQTAVTEGTTTGVADTTNKIASAKSTKINVNDDIFTYTQKEDINTDTEYKVTNTLKINLKADFTKIAGTDNSGGSLITTENTVTEGNEITISNEILPENTAEPIGNEIFDENKVAEEDIPDAGPEDWIQVAIVMVSVMIIFIMLMNLMTTRKIKNEQ